MRRNSAFTLIEVLIAVAILSIIMAVLYSTFFLSQKAVETVDGSLVRLQESRVVVDTLRREVESAYYRVDRPYSFFRVSDLDFFGKQVSQLAFTAFSPLLEGLSRITYTVEEEDGNLMLTKKIEAVFSPPENVKSVELIEEIASFDVKVKYNNEWVRTWDSGLAKKIPDEIEISLSIIPEKEENPVVISDRARPKIGRSL